MRRHNRSVGSPSTLTLSAVADGAFDGGAEQKVESRAQRPGSTVPRPAAANVIDVPVAVRPHIHNPRLCSVCLPARFEAIRAAPRARFPAALVAARIAREQGNVWPAAIDFGISYRHATAIRAGWRGGGRRDDPIPYQSRGWINGQRPGWSALRELKVAPPWNNGEPMWTIQGLASSA